MAQSAEDIAQEYESSLADLILNSKPLITVLTMLAEEYKEYGGVILKCIENHLEKVPIHSKLPTMYLIDSIIKNIGQPYISLIAENIDRLFAKTFSQVNDQVRSQMYKLRSTWDSYIPANKLRSLDTLVRKIDRGWPMLNNAVQSSTKPVSSSSVPNSTVTATSTGTAPASGTAASTVNSTTLDSATHEYLMKRKELMELKKKKIELNIERTKNLLYADKVKQNPQYSTELQRSMSNQMKILSEVMGRLRTINAALITSGKEQAKTKNSTTLSSPSKFVGTSPHPHRVVIAPPGVSKGATIPARTQPNMVTTSADTHPINVTAVVTTVTSSVVVTSIGSAVTTTATNGTNNVVVKQTYRIAPVSSGLINAAQRVRDPRLYKYELDRCKNNTASTGGTPTVATGQKTTDTKLFKREEKLPTPKDITCTASSSAFTVASIPSTINVTDKQTKGNDVSDIARSVVKPATVSTSTITTSVGTTNTASGMTAKKSKRIEYEPEYEVSRTKDRKSKRNKKYQDGGKRTDSNGEEPSDKKAKVSSKKRRLLYDRVIKNQDSIFIPDAITTTLTTKKRPVKEKERNKTEDSDTEDDSSEHFKWTKGRLDEYQNMITMLKTKSAASSEDTREASNVGPTKDSHVQNNKTKAESVIDFIEKRFGRIHEDRQDNKPKPPVRSLQAALEVPPNTDNNAEPLLQSSISEHTDDNPSEAPQKISEIPQPPPAPRITDIYNLEADHRDGRKDELLLLTEKQSERIDVDLTWEPEPEAPTPPNITVNSIFDIIDHVASEREAAAATFDSDVVSKKADKKEINENPAQVEVDLLDDDDELYCATSPPPAPRITPTTDITARIGNAVEAKRSPSPQSNPFGFDLTEVAGKDVDYRQMFFHFAPPPSTTATEPDNSQQATKRDSLAFLETDTADVDYRKKAKIESDDVDYRNKVTTIDRHPTALDVNDGGSAAPVVVAKAPDILGWLKQKTSTGSGRSRSDSSSSSDSNRSSLSNKSRTSNISNRSHCSSHDSIEEELGGRRIDSPSRLFDTKPATTIPLLSPPAAHLEQRSSNAVPMPPTIMHPPLVAPPEYNSFLQPRVGGLPNIKPTDSNVLRLIEEDPVTSMMFDGRSLDVRYYGNTAIVFYNWDDPHEVTFLGCDLRVLTVDNRFFIPLTLNTPDKDVVIDGITYKMRLGAPTRELYINGNGHSCQFGGPPVFIDFGIRKYYVKLDGPPPKVHIGFNKRVDLVAGKIIMVVDAKYQLPVYLDAKPQKIEIDGIALVLQFADNLRRLLINNQPFTANYGGPPQGFSLFGKEYYFCLSPLPSGIHPGFINIQHMMRTQLPSPPPPPMSMNAMRNIRNMSPTFAPVVTTVATHIPAVSQYATSMSSVMNMSPIPSFDLKPDVTDIPKSMMPVSISGPGYDSGGYSQSNVPTTAVAVSQTVPKSEPSVSSNPALNILGSLSIDELFQKLVASGIVPGSKSDDSDDKSIKEVDFSKPETFKQKQPGLITMLYSGIQCGSCGLRFPVDQAEKYSQHLDWHFRQNRKDRGASRSIHSRRWYYKVDDWIQFEEMEDADERAQSWFETQQTTSEEDTMEDVSSVPAGENAENAACELCQDKFEQFYNEEKEEWHLKPAVRESERLYHPQCYRDFKEKQNEIVDLEADEDEEKEVVVIEKNSTTVDLMDEDVEIKENEAEVANDTLELVDDREEMKAIKIKEEKIDPPESDENIPFIHENKLIEKPPVAKDVTGEDEESDLEEVELIEQPIESIEIQDDDKEEDPNLETLVVEDIVINDPSPQRSDEQQPLEQTAELAPSEPILQQVDITNTNTECSIDGNMELDDSPHPVSSGATKIKINISKPIAASAVETDQNEPTKEPPEPSKSSEESKVEGQKSPVDPNLVDADEPPPPGEEIVVARKPRLMESKLTSYPPLSKGHELSGLCSIM